MRYRELPAGSRADWSRLAASLGPERVRLLFKINRIDLAHVPVGGSLVAPESEWDEAALSPFPARVERLCGVPKMLLVSLRVQAFAAYERGARVRWGPTSSGRRPSPTPAGLFFVNWKAKETVSTENPEWLLPWYLNFDSLRGLSLHEYALPGHPASHACVRLHGDDSRWLYEWADQWIVSRDGRSVRADGTPILVFGEFDDRTAAPWRRLAADPAATDVGIGEIERALEPVATELAERVRRREAFEASRAGATATTKPAR